MKISKEVASSEYDAIANDALKDEDNGVWLASLPKSIQSVWIERFYWIRWVDRLAEQDQLVQPGGQQFPAFCQAWQRLRQQRQLSPPDRSWVVLQQIEACWFRGDDYGSFHQMEIEAWDCYMAAILDYHQPTLTLATLEDYEIMLDRLAGACFRLLPFLEDHQRAIVGGFGIIDQFYNNLRDLYEDSRRGICYFPTVLLNRFGVSRQEILDLSCFNNPGYVVLMKYWVDTYLPQLQQRHLARISVKDFHPVWQHLMAWFIYRYRRLERILRACQYNFETFATRYWQVVQQDLRQQAAANQPFPLQPQTLVEAPNLAIFFNPNSSDLAASEPLQLASTTALVQTFG